MNLVNKDQLEILATLRESVNEDKAGLESDMAIGHPDPRGLAASPSGAEPATGRWCSTSRG